MDREVRAGTRSSSNGVKKLDYSDGRADVPVAIANPETTKKLWRRYDLHGIRETARSLRVQAGTLEVAMVSTGKLEDARNALALMKNQITDLEIMLKGKK